MPIGTEALIEVLIEAITRAVRDYAEAPSPTPTHENPDPTPDPKAGESWRLKENASIEVLVNAVAGHYVSYAFVTSPERENTKTVDYFKDIYQPVG